MVSSMSWMSVGERLMILKISAVAVCCSRASASSRRSCSVSLISAAFVTDFGPLDRRAGSGFIPAPSFALAMLQPVRHPHLAVHRRRDGEVLLRLLALVRVPVELAEAEVAVGHEGAHTELIGECQGLTVVIESVLGAGRQRDVAGQAERVGLACARPEALSEHQGLAGMPGGLVDPPGREVGRPSA